jgi:hypothetical protein
VVESTVVRFDLNKEKSTNSKKLLVEGRRFGVSGVRHAESQQEAALFGTRPHARA